MISRQPKKCKHCRVPFTPEEMAGRMRLHNDCFAGFLNAMADKKMKARLKREKAEDKVRREKLKTNGQKKADAQRELNRWIVHGRDAHEPCISCGRHHAGIYHAGHYRSRGSAPHLALDPRNLHKQCAPCNLYLHGNLIEYRKGLVRRYSLEFVQALESDQSTKHYRGSDYEAIKTSYRQLLKEKEA